MTSAGNARDLLISAFPRGADFWRIDWFGEIDFPDRMLRHTQPSVLVHLSKITDPRILADPGIPVYPGSTAAVASQARCWVSVGAATLLRIGDIWSDQRFVWSPEHEVETFERIQIDRSTTQLLKVGHSDGQGNFLLPVEDHPWHMANTHSYCVRVALADARHIVWIATANDLEALDPPLRSRFAVHAIPPPDAAQGLALAGVIARALLRELGLTLAVPEAVLQRLALHTPRAQRQLLEDAMAEAVARGESSLRAADIPGVVKPARRPIGFVAAD